MADLLDQVKKIVEEALKEPLALPVIVGIATVLFTVVLFFNVSKSAQTKQKKRKSAKTEVTAGGTTTVDGVRRSTRAHKTTAKLQEVDDILLTPAPRKTPAKKTPATKEAITVSPKKRGRPAKSPARVAPTPVVEADSLPTSPRRRGRPRKA